ncbi:class I SAM-dependent methyltransferase [Roseomonas sp. GC11]|uniref:class I SAM-dependent methyltransferase n=1 Tax=Roseomonas sp. GC11 TaxID=2950546 RepID=UPI00210CA1B8|nr:class I SAM-dependent methyltransferase [Roseomonas sp. GC11]
MAQPAPAPPPALLTAEAVSTMLRMLLGRGPRSAEELAELRHHPDTAALRNTLLRGPEFTRLYRAATKQSAGYAMPLFMLAPPEDPKVPWCFQDPSLAEPVSQLCTAAQMQEPAHQQWSRFTRSPPRPHRKQWEFSWILAALNRAEMLRPGLSGLGFGVGRERLPSALANLGHRIVASDAPPELAAVQGWATTKQYSDSLEQLFKPELIDAASFAERVTFRPVDMNAIPDELRGFDYCWSACALEHLGSLQHGLDFVRNSLETLRPGGLALHTTEFNLGSNEQTLESRGLSLYRKRDIEALASRLVAEGHEVWPLNFHPGHALGDVYIDTPPFSTPHVKLQAAGHVVTSIGLAVRRRG